MAFADFSRDPRAPHPHPAAVHGYGKRSVPDQATRRRDDFAHLRPREASIATYIDRLPDGSSMDAKTLASQLPDYGQAACLTALRRLSEAGHLRRVTERIKGDGGSWNWVTRTYFSRAARSDDWWETFLAGNLPGDTGPQPGCGGRGRGGVGPARGVTRDLRAVRRETGQRRVTGPVNHAAPEGPPRPAPDPPPTRTRSRAYLLLASVGRADPRMTLSAAECAALEGLAAQWLELGADDADVVRALTAGLPPDVHSAGALARRRLVDKMPPELPDPRPGPRPEPAPPPPLRIVECTVCRAPGRPEAFPGGVCRHCRGEDGPPTPYGVPPADVPARVAAIRAAVRTCGRAVD
ncbi:hypothetical protein [Streptomyces albireticuli]|uniref:hypothetical protein n=1 Tax=Streptomyces albireticuli TaxID=1940 RepID=UPI00369E1A75